MISLEKIVKVADIPSLETEMIEEIEKLREWIVPRFASFSHHGENVCKDRREAMMLGVGAVNAILPIILKYGDVDRAESAHGPGHWLRDLANTLQIANDEIVPVGHVVSVVVAGTLHDIGTMFVDRFSEKERVVRHAEVGALAVYAAAVESKTSRGENAHLASYIIAAHTNYMRPMVVMCKDGHRRTTEPYPDMTDNKPFLPVWAVRWADRLDLVGPCMVGRQLFTLWRDHDDFSPEDGYFAKSFVPFMRPFIRSDGEIKEASGERTLLEFLDMLARSQTSDSPYGKHDAGVMVALRDANKESLEHVIWSVLHPQGVDVERILKAWTLFLGTNVGPTRAGRMAAHDLGFRFRNLDPDVRRAWACGFRTTMCEYLLWADRTLAFLNRMPAECLQLCGLFPDIRDAIRPNRAWVNVLIDS